MSEREAILGTSSTKCSASGPGAAAARSEHQRHPRQHVQAGLRRAGGKLERVAVGFQDDKHLMRVIDRIVSAVGRRVDDSSPMVDARLPDGSRVNAIIAPLAVDGPLLDPPLPGGAAEGGRSGQPSRDYAADARLRRALRAVASERPGQRRHRRRQDRRC